MIHVGRDKARRAGRPDEELACLFHFMLWNIKYLVYNNVKWPGPELWCRDGFSVCFVVYGFEILIFGCRLIRLSGLAGMNDGLCISCFLKHWAQLCSRPLRGHVWDVLSAGVLVCQSSRKIRRDEGFHHHRHSSTASARLCLQENVTFVSMSFKTCSFFLKLLRCLRGVYHEFIPPHPVII